MTQAGNGSAPLMGLPAQLYQQPWPSGDYRLFQLGWLVEDLSAAMRKWVEVYGVGPFHVMPRVAQSVLYRGTETEVTVEIAVAQAGPVQIELIQQHSDTPSVYREIFPRGSGGLHHICTVTDRFEETIDRYERLGYKAIALARGRTTRAAFIDTRGDFGLVTEIADATPAFLGALARIAESCAGWDGRDPIRLMRRGGYDLPAVP